MIVGQRMMTASNIKFIIFIKDRMLLISAISLYITVSIIITVHNEVLQMIKSNLIKDPTHLS